MASQSSDAGSSSSSNAPKVRKTPVVRVPKEKAAHEPRAASLDEDLSGDSGSDDGNNRQQDEAQDRQIDDTDSGNEVVDIDLIWEEEPCKPIPTTVKPFLGVVPVEISTLKPAFTQVRLGS